MAKTKAYPPTSNFRSGCKVGWRYYDRLPDAKKCAEAAKWNAAYYASCGYDFGYCMPGSIRKMKDCEGEWAKYNGKYEVCIP